MTVNVLLFAAARESVGQSEIQIQLSEGASIDDLRLLLEQSFPEMKKLLSSSSWSVNQKYVREDHLLSDGCEVGVIAPVSGG